MTRAFPSCKSRESPIAEAVVSRPQDLHEVALATIAGTNSSGNAIDESPPAFCSGMIFTFIEPLRRARFPRDVARIRRP
jgi:hypothetical protein